MKKKVESLSDLNVVLLHDWLTGLRGGERVLEAFCELFPTAPLYTLIHIPHSTSPFIENRAITASFLNRFPGVQQHYRKFLPLFPLAAESLSILEDADLILSSSHCVIKGVPKTGKAKHISYIHSPMRYMYDQFDVYFGKDTPFLQRNVAKMIRPFMQTWDRISNDQVDLMVANSGFVRDRIRRCYQREAQVIHPFVDLKDFDYLKTEAPVKENFYLMVTAFAPNKRVDLAAMAFNQLNLPLKIVGSGQQEKSLRKMAGPTIEFLGNKNREEVIDLMAKAKAFIFPGVEDFGITPLEALASGTPVIAFKAGGVLETLDEQVALFFEEDSVESLVQCLDQFNPNSFHSPTLIQRAQEFSKEKFLRNLTETILSVF